MKKLMGSLITAGIFMSPYALCQDATQVQRLMLKQEFLPALTEYDKMPKRRTTVQAVLAAGKSAWALSLPIRAEEELSKVLLMEGVTESDRTEALFSRAIIKYQEGRFQESIVDIEKVIGLLKKPSAERGRAYLLWGENEQALGAHGKAVDLFERAATELHPEEQGNAYLGLGKSLQRLGKGNDAVEALEQVKAPSDLKLETIRALVPLYLELNRYQEAQELLKNAYSEFRELAVESYYDYALIRAFVGLEKLREARTALQGASARFAPSDPWITLAEGMVEEALATGSTTQLEMQEKRREWREVRNETVVLPRGKGE